MRWSGSSGVTLSPRPAPDKLENGRGCAVKSPSHSVESELGEGLDTSYAAPATRPAPAPAPVTGDTPIPPPLVVILGPTASLFRLSLVRSARPGIHHERLR